MQDRPREVSLPAPRGVVNPDRRRCTWICETTNETDPPSQTRGPGGRLEGAAILAVAYDQIADWYEHEFLSRQPEADCTSIAIPSASIGRWLSFWVLYSSPLSPLAGGSKPRIESWMRTPGGMVIRSCWGRRRPVAV